jgi:hypothetical protein
MARTAEQLATTLADAAQAVRHYYGSDERDYHELTVVGAGTQPRPAARAAYDEVGRALRAGHSAAAVAVAAGVRQLLIVGLIGDANARAAALVAARHDAQRYQTQVMAALRDEVLAAITDGMSEYRAERVYGVTRATIRDWRGKV